MRGMRGWITPALGDGGSVEGMDSPGSSEGHFHGLPPEATCGGADARGRLARGLCGAGSWLAAGDTIYDTVCIYTMRYEWDEGRTS